MRLGNAIGVTDSKQIEDGVQHGDVQTSGRQGWVQGADIGVDSVDQGVFFQQLVLQQALRWLLGLR